MVSTRRTGKNRLQVSLETRDEAEAIDKAKAILENPELNPCNGFLTELNRYADEQVADGIWTSNSKDSKTTVLKMFGEDLGYKNLPDITTEEVKAWYERQKKRVPPSAHSYLLTVRAFLNWAVEKKMMRKSPAEDVKLGKVTQASRIRFCTFEQRDTIVKAAEGDDELLFVLYCGFYAGMRKDEIIEARPEWFDLDHNLVHIEKTATFSIKNKKYRTIPMHPEFRRFLERYGKKAPYMLKPDVKKGKARYRYDFRKPFADHMNSLKLGWVTPHVMRHTFASLLAINNVSLFKNRQVVGGHAGDHGETLCAPRAGRRRHRHVVYSVSKEGGDVTAGGNPGVAAKGEPFRGRPQGVGGGRSVGNILGAARQGSAQGGGREVNAVATLRPPRFQAAWAGGSSVPGAFEGQPRPVVASVWGPARMLLGRIQRIGPVSVRFRVWKRRPRGGGRSKASCGAWR